MPSKASLNLPPTPSALPTAADVPLAALRCRMSCCSSRPKREAAAAAALQLGPLELVRRANSARQAAERATDADADADFSALSSFTHSPRSPPPGGPGEAGSWNHNGTPEAVSAQRRPPAGADSDGQITIVGHCDGCGRALEEGKISNGP